MERDILLHNLKNFYFVSGVESSFIDIILFDEDEFIEKSDGFESHIKDLISGVVGDTLYGGEQGNCVNNTQYNRIINIEIINGVLYLEYENFHMSPTKEISDLLQKRYENGGMLHIKQIEEHNNNIILNKIVYSSINYKYLSDGNMCATRLFIPENVITITNIYNKTIITKNFKIQINQHGFI